jgi:hypothetical protein
VTLVSQILSGFPGQCSPETGIAYLGGFLSGGIFVSCAFVLKGLRRW